MRWTVRITPVLYYLSYALLVACPPGPLSPPPDATDGAPPGPPDGSVPTQDAPEPPPPIDDDAEAVCANLRALGCPLQGGPECASVLRHVLDAGLTPVNVPCLKAAKSRADVRACGFVSCAGG